MKRNDREGRERDAAREGRYVRPAIAPAETPPTTNTDEACSLCPYGRTGRSCRCRRQRGGDVCTAKPGCVCGLPSREGSKPADARGSSATAHDESGGDRPITLARLRQHPDCMRAHGVNVPDPVETANGWTIPVEDPPFQKDQRAWRNAFFVSCRLLDVSEKLVLGGRTSAGIETLMDCTRAHGFVLPQTNVERGRRNLIRSQQSAVGVGFRRLVPHGRRHLCRTPAGPLARASPVRRSRTRS